MQISGVTIQGGMNILPAGGSPSPSPAPTPAPSDPNFSNVIFLFDGDGTNGADNNTFTDSSTNGYTVTESGSVVQGRFSPYTTEGGSAYFDISNQSYLSYAGGSSTVGDITVSGWVYVDQSTGVNNGLYPRVFASGGTQFLVYLRDGAFRVYNGGEVLGAGIHSNTWYHFVVQRTSGTFELWLNGESQGTASNSTNINLNTTNYIGTDPSGGYYGGYLTDLKVTEASEGYSGNFTPPTSPVSAGSSDLLLNFQDAAIFDYSGINNIDTIGAQITTAVKKFGTGSVEFNGTSDYLNIPNKSQWDLSSADFTIEAWAYADTLGSYNSIIGQWPNGGGSNSNSFVLETVGSEMRFYFCSGTNLAYNSLGAISTGSWDHWAVTREGTTLRGFKNGTLVFTNASFGGMNNAPSDITVGGNVAGAGYWDGYIDDLRITKGVARYTANFTAPTAALPTVAGTPTDSNFSNVSLLLNGDGTNGSTTFTDLSSNGHTVTAVGDAQVSTSIKKFGTGSIKFDGTGDYLEIPSSDAFDLGTDDWTIEGWIYPESDSDDRGAVFELYNDDSNVLRIMMNTSDQIEFRIESGGTRVVDIRSTNWNYNEWMHVAVVNNSGTIAFYLNGTSEGTDSSFTMPDFSSARVLLGMDLLAIDRWYTGYIDDFRVTKGVARYTSNFTAPTAAFPTS